MASTFVASTLLLGFFLLAVGIAIRSRRWRRGVAIDTRFFSRMWQLPKLYLVDVHDVVVSKPFVARMHACVAGGFIAVILLALVVHLGGWDVSAVNWVLLAMLGLMGTGAAMVLWRRIKKPNSLSGGGFSRLPYSLLAFVLGLTWLSLPSVGLIDAAPFYSWTNLLAAALFAWGVFELISGMSGGPMKHSLIGALHLIAHPRPERFNRQQGATALKRQDLEATKLGVETAQDLHWNRLLSFDACVQCGRCEEACPAFAAGQPLNPKKLVQDLVHASQLTPGDNRSFAGSAYPRKESFVGRGASHLPIIGDDAMIPDETLWACTTCRACVQECPMMIEHVDAVVDLRRFQVLEKGCMPSGSVKVIEAIRETDNRFEKTAQSRLDWAADLNLKRLSEVKSTEVLLWLGDAAFELRNQRTLRALVKLLNHAQVDFAVLGEEELDVGETARRLGDEATFSVLATRNIETLNRYTFSKIVTADPHAFHTLKNEYPDFGGEYRVAHHTTFLNELIECSRLEVSPLDEESQITYHDPCYLGRYNSEYVAPRALLDALSLNRVEMRRAQVKSRCCGGGGGAPFSDIDGERRIPDIRMADAEEVGAETVAVACPGCMMMLDGVVEPRPAVKDVAELLLEGVEKAEANQKERAN